MPHHILKKSTYLIWAYNIYNKKDVSKCELTLDELTWKMKKKSEIIHRIKTEILYKYFYLYNNIYPVKINWDHKIKII